MKNYLKKSRIMLTALASLAASAGAAAAVTCDVKVVSQWNNGYTTDIQVKNTGPLTTTDWTVEIVFPEANSISQIWNGIKQETGGRILVKNASWNGNLVVNQTTNFGFTASHDGSLQAPSCRAFVPGGSSSSSSSSSSGGTTALILTTSLSHPAVNQSIPFTASTSTPGWNFSWSVVESPNYLRDQLKQLHLPGLNMCAAKDHDLPLLGKAYRLRGWFMPPRTGNYAFALSATSEAQLFLSTNEQASNAQLKAALASGTDLADFNTNQSQQRSEEVFLEAGKKYYTEILYVHPSFTGHFSLGIRAPGESQFTPASADAFLSLDAPGLTQPNGALSREIFIDNSLFTLNSVKSMPEFNGQSRFAGTLVGNNGQANFNPRIHGPFKIQVTATNGNQILQKTLPLFVESSIRNGNAEQTISRADWIVSPSNGAATLERRAGCGKDGSSCLVIDAPNGQFHAGEFLQRIELKPQTFYRLTADVRGENIAYFNSADKGPDKGLDVKGPRILVRSTGDAVVGLPIDSQGWQKISIDFSANILGWTFVHIIMGEASGRFFVDNIKIEPMDNEVTQIDTEAFRFNVHNDDIAAAGGIEVAKAHAEKVSRYIKAIADLTGIDNLSCYKESNFSPRDWPLHTAGFNGNPISHVPHSPFVVSQLWKTPDAIDGIFAHEFTHNYEFGPWKFGTHIPFLVETYPLSTLGFKRVDGDQPFAEIPWRQQMVNVISPLAPKGCFTLYYFHEKLFQFKDKHGWAPIKQVMRNTFTGEMSSWPQDMPDRSTVAAQYQTWWQKLETITGDNGWMSLHTQAERDGFNRVTQKIIPRTPQSPIGFVGNRLPLADAEIVEEAFMHVPTLRNVQNLDVGQELCSANGPVGGIFSHAPSRLRFDLGGQWQTFSGAAAVQWGALPGTVVAVVRVDGVERFRSGIITSSMAPVPFNVPVAGAQTLELQFTNAGDSDNTDWSMWVDPVLTR